MVKQKVFLGEIKSVLIVSLFIVLTLSSLSALAQSDENTLYLTVIELFGSPETGMETPITTANVSLAYGSIGGEQSMPAAWQDVPVDTDGQAVFSGLTDGVVYTIGAKAPGYLSAQKEFRKNPGVAYASIILVKAPQGATGSVRVPVLVQAPQGPVALTTAEIEILKAGEVVARADTKNTKGKEGVVFSDLLIGEDYEAYVTAPGYEFQRKSFTIETNKETWLPIILERVQIKPETCPENCSCDSQGNIIYCAEVAEVEPGIEVTPQEAAKKAVEQTQLDIVKTVEEDSLDGKTVYEVEGVSKVRLFAFIPIQMKIKVVVEAEEGLIRRIQKPWWSFLTRHVG